MKSKGMLTLNESGYVKQRESQVLEFKETFRFGESLVEYARSLVGMANNQGGMIVFGIKDKPHEPIGLLDDRFDKFDPRELNKIFLEYFSVDIEWNAETINFNSTRFGC
ncbi:MAG TPA: ATP-binding protein [Methylotenera sp.]|nr:ATP-binding protein [Methylotenera sp.]